MPHRSSCLEGVCGTADHERQRARDRTLDPTGDWGVELGEASLGGVGVHAARIVHGDRRTVDEQGALGGGWHDVGVTLLHEGAAGQHGDHDIGILRRGGRAFEDGHTTIGGSLSGGGHGVKAPHGVAGINEVA